MKRFRKLFFFLQYLGNPPWETNQTPPEVLTFIKNHPPGRALDLGCGTGTNAITLAQHGWQVTGVDFVGKAIRRARQKARQAHLAIDFHTTDVTRLPNALGQFDLILDIGCYHNLSTDGMRAYRENVKKLLKASGSFMLYAFSQAEDLDVGTGVAEADLQAFASFLTLEDRADGWERGTRPSVWLTYRKDKG